MINEKEVFKPILEIIGFNYPTQRKKEKVYRGKTIFFERVFFKTLSHICQECLVNSASDSFLTQFPDNIHITKHVPKLVVKNEHWEMIIKETGFDIPENRNIWAKLVLEFTKYQLDLAENITLPENIRFSEIQTTFLVLFCYFYYFNKNYMRLSSERESFFLSDKKHITWSLVETGNISQFVAPLRTLSVFGQFDERDLANFFKLSGNSLKALNWILRAVYEEWFRPFRSSVRSLYRNAVLLSDERFPVSIPSVVRNNNDSRVLSSPTGKLPSIPLPRISMDSRKNENAENDISVEQEDKDWKEMYYEKVLEVQELRQRLLEKKDHVSDEEILEVFDELLRNPGEFEGLFLKVVPHRGPKTNMRKWIAIERTFLNLRSLFTNSGFVAFGEINKTISMETVEWPYAIDKRVSFRNTDICDKWNFYGVFIL